MPYNFLLIPIIASYIILRYSLFFKYNLQRRSKDVLVFETLVLSIPIIVISVTINRISKTLYPNAYKESANFFGNEVLNANTPFFYSFIFCSFVIVVLFWIFQRVMKILQDNNLIIDENYFVKRAVRKYGDELEKFITRCIIEGKAAQFTLKNGKVYIGFCMEIPTPGSNNYIFVIPFYSGYREKESHVIKITTSYGEPLLYIMKEDKSKLNLMGVSFKKDEILSFSIHDKEIFSKFKNIQGA